MTKTDLIKQLRSSTAASMSDCVSALKEANDDLEKAIDIIKVKGKNIISSREGKIASEGVLASHHIDGGTGRDVFLCVEVNSQTDFVSNMSEFVEFGGNVVRHLFKTFKQSDFVLPPELEETRKNLIAKTKENIVVRRWWVEVAGENERVFSYRHSTKLEAVVVLSGNNLDTEEIEKLGNNLCLQVAAMNPLAITFEEIAPEVVARQQEIISEQIGEELIKNPKLNPKGLEGMKTGKIRKWKEEVCLLDQTSIIDSKKTVREMIAAIPGVSVKKFIRAQVGEGIEKAEENFAEEVAKMTGESN